MPTLAEINYLLGGFLAGTGEARKMHAADLWRQWEAALRQGEYEAQRQLQQAQMGHWQESLRLERQRLAQAQKQAQRQYELNRSAQAETKAYHRGWLDIQRQQLEAQREDEAGNLVETAMRSGWSVYSPPTPTGRQPANALVTTWQGRTLYLVPPRGGPDPQMLNAITNAVDRGVVSAQQANQLSQSHGWGLEFQQPPPDPTQASQAVERAVNVGIHAANYGATPEQAATLANSVALAAGVPAVFDAKWFENAQMSVADAARLQIEAYNAVSGRIRALRTGAGGGGQPSFEQLRLHYSKLQTMYDTINNKIAKLQDEMAELSPRDTRGRARIQQQIDSLRNQRYSVNVSLVEAMQSMNMPISVGRQIGYVVARWKMGLIRDEAGRIPSRESMLALLSKTFGRPPAVLERQYPELAGRKPKPGEMEDVVGKALRGAGIGDYAARVRGLQR